MKMLKMFFNFRSDQIIQAPDIFKTLAYSELKKFKIP